MWTLDKMANIGRAYCRIMPTAAALLRDILRKKKKKRYAETRGPGASRSADVQDVAVISVYASRGDSPLCINTYMNFGVTKNVNASSERSSWETEIRADNFKRLSFSYCRIDLSSFSKLLLYKYFVKFVVKKKKKMQTQIIISFD